MPMISVPCGNIEELQHLFRIGHLRNRGGRNEADRVDVRETCGDERLKIIRLVLRGNMHGQCLPGIARTFNDLDAVRHRTLYQPREG